MPSQDSSLVYFYEAFYPGGPAKEIKNWLIIVSISFGMKRLLLSGKCINPSHPVEKGFRVNVYRWLNYGGYNYEDWYTSRVQRINGELLLWQYLSVQNYIGGKKDTSRCM